MPQPQTIFQVIAEQGKIPYPLAGDSPAGTGWKVHWQSEYGRFFRAAVSAGYGHLFPIAAGCQGFDLSFQRDRTRGAPAIGHQRSSHGPAQSPGDGNHSQAGVQPHASLWSATGAAIC